jgi:hypothetical protein
LRTRSYLLGSPPKHLPCANERPSLAGIDGQPFVARVNAPPLGPTDCAFAKMTRLVLHTSWVGELKGSTTPVSTASCTDDPDRMLGPYIPRSCDDAGAVKAFRLTSYHNERARFLCNPSAESNALGKRCCVTITYSAIFPMPVYAHKLCDLTTRILYLTQVHFFVGVESMFRGVVW